MWALLLLFVFAPLIELYFLIQVGSVIGALPTILLSIVTAVIGGYLVRLQGVAVLLRVRSMLDRGETPALELMDGAILLVCGFALLLPGFITDVAGFVLLIPAVRHALIRRYVALVPVQGEAAPARETQGQRTIEGEWRRDD